MLPPPWRLLGLLLQILSYIIFTYQTDLGHRGRQLIMQADIETVIVALDLRKINSTLGQINHTLNIMELGSITVGNNVKEGKQVGKSLLSVVRALQELLNRSESKFNLLLEQSDTKDNRQERGLEFLGEMLSTITGVPSAQDHRKSLELLSALRTRSQGIETILAQTTDVNRKIL